MSTAPQPFFTTYTRLVTETDLVAAMRQQAGELEHLFGSIPDAESRKTHGPYTWTLKQVIQHIADAERVFGYRAMRFARKDATPLPGFDENAYAANADGDNRPVADIVDEFAALRRSHVLLFGSFKPETWSQSGTASNVTWTVADLAKAIIGHSRHHATIIRKRLEMK